MPFTPFHFGPGLLLKGLVPHHISLSTFALANVVMDIEPLHHLWRGDVQLHGLTHSVPGALVIGAAVAMGAPALVRCGWQRLASAAPGSEVRISRKQAWLSALLGSGSHVVLDAVMHRDMQPLWPFSPANPLLDPTWTQNIYLACVLAGMLGLLLQLLRVGLTGRRAH